MFFCKLMTVPAQMSAQMRISVALLKPYKVFLHNTKDVLRIAKDFEHFSSYYREFLHITKKKCSVLRMLKILCKVLTVCAI